MNVNKKKLAEIFNVDIRTIDRWQTQGPLRYLVEEKVLRSSLILRRRSNGMLSAKLILKMKNSVKRSRI